MNSEFLVRFHFHPFKFPETHPTSEKHPTFPLITTITLLTTYPLSPVLPINLYQYHYYHIPASTARKICHRFRSQPYLLHLRASRRDPCEDSSLQEVATSGTIYNREVTR